MIGAADDGGEPLGGDGIPPPPGVDEDALVSDQPEIASEGSGSAESGDDRFETVHGDNLRNVRRKSKTFSKAEEDTPPDIMSGIAERLQEARRKAGYATATDAARAFGWNVMTYGVHESGGRGLRPEVALKYARAFRVSPGWLLTGAGDRSPLPTIVTIVGYVGAGAEVFAWTENEAGDGLDTIEAPYGTSDDAVAVIVRGDSCNPVFVDGELIIYSERRHDVAEFLYRVKPMIIGLRDGRRLLKQLAPGTTAGLFTLNSPNASPIPNVDVEWVARIDWTKPPK